MKLQCALSVLRFLQTRFPTIMIQKWSKKCFFGLVLNHYGTGTHLKKIVGLLKHTLIPHFEHFLTFDI